MKKILLCVIMFFSLLSINAQSKSFCLDTLAFRSYLSNNIGTAMDVQILLKTYQRLKAPNMYEQGKLKNFLPDIAFDDGIVVGRHWHMDNVRFPDSLRMGLIHDARAYRTGKDMKAEKARLVDNLRKFDAVSCNKPIFFATIYSQYKGDIEKYVDDLYSKSIMGSKWRMGLFCRWPSAKKLQEDLSVQFAIGLALYDLWIKRGRAGNTEEMSHLVMVGDD